MANNPIYSRHHSRGFTITELLVTFFILGILTNISIGYFDRSWKREQLKLLAKTAETLLENARVTAIHSSQACKLLIDDSNASIEPSSAGNDCSELTTLDIKADVDFGSKVIICSRESFDESSDIFQCNATHSNPDGTEITFTPRGTSVNNALIKLSIPDYNQLVRCSYLSPASYVSVDKGDGCNFKTAA